MGAWRSSADAHGEALATPRQIERRPAGADSQTQRLDGHAMVGLRRDIERDRAPGMWGDLKARRPQTTQVEKALAVPHWIEQRGMCEPHGQHLPCATGFPSAFSLSGSTDVPVTSSPASLVMLVSRRRAAERTGLRVVFVTIW